ncbi:MAG: hypothetical protein AAF483_03400, partial [Planctomycetota bacterium]
MLLEKKAENGQPLCGRRSKGLPRANVVRGRTNFGFSPALSLDAPWKLVFLALKGMEHRLDPLNYRMVQRR